MYEQQESKGIEIPVHHGLGTHPLLDRQTRLKTIAFRRTTNFVGKKTGSMLNICVGLRALRWLQKQNSGVTWPWALEYLFWLIQTELDRDRDQDRDNWLTVYYAEPFTLQWEWDRDRDQKRDQWLTKPFCTFPGTVACTLAGTYIYNVYGSQSQSWSRSPGSVKDSA